MSKTYIGVQNVNSFMTGNKDRVVSIFCSVREEGEKSSQEKTLSCVNDEEITKLVLELAEKVAIKNGYELVYKVKAGE